ncbi:MAG: NAD(+) synthase [Clostridia bacterium]|nr:NAD(+) synthase [Clostridia bacterium]
MKYGFIRAAAATPDVKAADCGYNTQNIIKCINEACDKNAELAVFPELVVTGYTCGDLFSQRRLIKAAYESMNEIKKSTEGKNIVVVVGFPFEYNCNLYNCGAVLYNGRTLAVVPKSFLPNYNEFYEMRWFREALKETIIIDFLGEKIPFGTNVVVKSSYMPEFALGVEICEDLWSVIPPSLNHALAGATIIANPSAGNEITGKDVYRKSLVEGQSARIIGGYVYACAGGGESTTDVVYSGHNLICENGITLNESERFKNGIIYGDIDVYKMESERQRNTSFRTDESNYTVVKFDFKPNSCDINRFVDPKPFVPKDLKKRAKRCEEIINIQAYGLKKRIEHIGCENVVIGISGGLDSTQALIVTSRAFELLNMDKKGIIAVTMPCFGTTDRTYNNAVSLVKELGATLVEVNIKNAVMQHFEDIGHNPDIHDLTYENSQARERTMVLMNMASKYKGFVVGTGDLSELALGWATYNGDHMSMYGVNCSIPKTLIKYLIQYVADTTDDDKLREILKDILDTPVSPELLPPDEKGEIAQITEDVVGPYELHDFFLYNMMRLAYEPDKIFYMACIAFKGVYEKAVIYKWLRNFYWRFFSQQFKRSCLPDGPKVGSVSLSPRGDWRMPSDASVGEWMKILDEIKKENGYM